MAEITTVFDRLKEWHQANYGRNANFTLTFRKLCEELGELGQAIAGGSFDDIAEESADCMMILAHIIHAANKSVEEAIAEKLDKIERRSVRRGKPSSVPCEKRILRIELSGNVAVVIRHGQFALIKEGFFLSIGGAWIAGDVNDPHFLTTRVRRFTTLSDALKEAADCVPGDVRS